MTVLDIVIQGQDDASDELKNVDSALGNLGSKAGSVAAAGLGIAAAGVAAVGAAAVAAGAAAFNLSSDISNATNNIAAQMGISKSEAEGFEGVMKGIFANNFGDSFEDISAAIVTVTQSLGEMSDADLQGITEDAFALRDAFGLEVGESIDAARVLMEQMGLSGEQAMDLIASGMQNGLNANDDFIDSIREYGNLFSEAGFSAEQMYSIMETGAQSGVLGTDKIADAIKEMTIKLNEGGEDTKAAFDTIGLSFDDIAASVAAGDETWADYFDSIVGGLADIEDPMERSKAQTAIFGTMAEDLGVSFTDALSDMSTSLEDMSSATEDLNAQYDNWGSMWEGVKRQALLALEPLGDELFNIAQDILPKAQEAFEKITKWVSENLPKAIDTAKEIVADLREKWETNFAGIRDFLSGVWDTIEQTWDAFKSLFEGDFVAFGEKIQTAWETAWTTVTEFMSTLWPMIKPKLEQMWIDFKAWFAATDWGAVGEMILNAIGAYLQLHANIAKWILSALEKIATAIFEWAKTVDWQQVAETILTLISAGIDALKHHALDMGNKIAILVIEGLSAFNDFIGPKLAEWQAKFQAWVDDTFTWENFGYLIGSAIVAGIDFIKDLPGKLQEFWDSLTTWFDDQAFDEKGAQASGKIAEGLEKLWENAKVKFDDFLTSAGDWFKDPEKWKELGKAVIQGIIDGINELYDKLMGIIADIGEGIERAFKRKEEIESPSKVWMQFGLMLMEGLIQGITIGEDGVLRVITNLGEEIELAAIKKFAETIAALVAVSGPFMQMMAIIANMNLDSNIVKKKLDEFGEMLYYIGRVFASAGWNLVYLNRDEAKRMAEMLRPVAESTIIGLEALKLFEDVQFPVDLKSRLDQFAQFIEDIALKFAELAIGMTTELSDSLKAYADGLVAVMAMIEPAIKGMIALSEVDFEPIVRGFHLAEQIEIFKRVIRFTMLQIGEAALLLSADMSQQVGALANAVKQVYDAVESVLAGITILSEFDFGPVVRGFHLAEQIRIFRNVIRATARMFSEGAAEMDSELLGAIQEMISAASAVFGIIQQALDAIVLISEFDFESAVSGMRLAEQLEQLKLFIADLVTKFREVAESISTELAEQITATATALQAVTGTITGVIDSITAINDYVPVGEGFLMGPLQDFLADLVLTAEQLLGIFNLLQWRFSLWLEPAQEAAGAVSAVFGPIKTIIEGLQLIADYVPVGADFLTGPLSDFLGDLVITAEQLLGIFNLLQWRFSAWLEPVQEVVGVITTVFGAIKQITDGITAIAEYSEAEGLEAKMDAIMGAIGTVLDRLRQLATMDVPGGIREIMASIVQTMRDAIPQAASAGYDFGLAWMDGLRQALGMIGADIGVSGNGSGAGGLAGAANGAAMAGGLTTNLNMGGLTFNTTINSQMDEDEFAFRVIEIIRGLV